MRRAMAARHTAGGDDSPTRNVSDGRVSNALRSRWRASLWRNDMATLNINGKVHEVVVEADTPLLWVIREQVGLTGTKYGCGVAQCGACSVHLNGQVVRSC